MQLIWSLIVLLFVLWLVVIVAAVMIVINLMSGRGARL